MLQQFVLPIIINSPFEVYISVLSLELEKNYHRETNNHEDNKCKNICTNMIHEP